MWQYLLKIVISVIVIVAISELAKRSTFWGAALASLPLLSVLAFIWLYLDTGDINQVSALSTGIFWLVLPSLVLFIALPLLLRSGFGFWPSLGSSCIATAIAYFGMIKILAIFGIRL